MPKAFEQWTVLPHGPIEKLSPNLWRVQASLPNMPLQRVMSLARRDDGRLVVHNGVALEDALIAEIEGFGEPGFLVVPNAYHRLDAKAYVKRYPKIKVVCPRGAKAQVSEVVQVTHTYADYPNDPAVEIEHLEGVNEKEGVMIVRSAEGTSLVFNDIIFNMPHGTGALGFIFRHIVGSTGGPRISRLARLLLVNNTAALRGHLDRLARLDGLRRILVAHHEAVTDRAAEVLAAVAATL
jgi:hypothetical protein